MITVSGKSTFSFIRSFHNGAQFFFSDCFVRSQDSLLFVRPVARQNSVEYAVRMIAKVAYIIWCSKQVKATVAF